MHLVGQNAETALTSCLASIKFHEQQKDLAFEMRIQQLEARIDANQAKFQKKLQEVYNGYKAVSDQTYVNDTCMLGRGQDMCFADLL